jgi:Mismatch repair ATPase (MutS family)
MRAWQDGKIGHKQAMKEMAAKRKELAAQAEQTNESAVEQDVRLEDLRPGQTVMHRPWNKRAVVCEVDVRQQRVKLDLSGVTLWADAAHLGSAVSGQLSPVRPQGVVMTRRSDSGAPDGQRTSLLSLDLRGKRADLAEGELSRFLDAALLAGRDEVEIIHGRGTGVLRKQVHAFLKTFPGVAAFELAPEDRGGDGMTIVTFR